jgi:hypothetical protein
MKIELNKATEVVVVTEKKISVEEITINELIDLPARKMVVAKTKEIGQVILWKDADYDAIGQWTDTDVVARISELYNA